MPAATHAGPRPPSIRLLDLYLIFLLFRLGDLLLSDELEEEDDESGVEELEDDEDDKLDVEDDELEDEDEELEHEDLARFFELLADRLDVRPHFDEPRFGAHFRPSCSSSGPC